MNISINRYMCIHMGVYCTAEHCVMLLVYYICLNRTVSTFILCQVLFNMSAVSYHVFSGCILSRYIILHCSVLFPILYCLMVNYFKCVEGDQNLFKVDLAALSRRQRMCYEMFVEVRLVRMLEKQHRILYMCYYTWYLLLS